MRPPGQSVLRIAVPQRAAMSLLAGFLLALYMLGGFWRAPGQPHAHDQSLEIHFSGCEQDPCHAAVYHHDRSGDCHHRSHLTRSIDGECSLCGMMFFRQDLPPTTVSFPIPEKDSATPVIPQETLVIVTTAVPFGRGPPAA